MIYTCNACSHDLVCLHYPTQREKHPVKCPDCGSVQELEFIGENEYGHLDQKMAVFRPVQECLELTDIEELYMEELGKWSYIQKRSRKYVPE